MVKLIAKLVWLKYNQTFINRYQFSVKNNLGVLK